MKRSAAPGTAAGLVVPLRAGALSGLMYLSYLFAFGYLVPVQYAFARGGARTGLAAAGISLAVVATGQLGRAISIGADFAPMLAMGMLPPAVLLAALSAVNLIRRPARAQLRILAATLLIASLAVPAISGIASDAENTRWIVRAVTRTLESAGAAAGAASAGGMQAAEVEALATEAVASTLRVVTRGFGAICLAYLGGSWWLGRLIAARRMPAGRALAGTAQPAVPAAVQEPAPESEAAGHEPLSRFSLPEWFVWPVLAAWAALFATLVLKVEGLAADAAWNVALIGAACYAAQGLAVISFLSTTRWNFPRALRAGVAMLVAAALVVPGLATLLAVVLPLLGISEVWIPFRRNKGAHA